MSATILDSEYDGCDRLGWMQTGLLSIESAMVEITDGDRNRHIYGDIHVDRGHQGKAYSVYHRSPGEAEFVSSQRYLTLCGPRYCVTAPEALYVDLHELEGEAPFLRTTVPLSPLIKENRRSAENGESFEVYVDGDKGTLSLWITVVKPSVLTRVQVDLLNVEDWLVSGTVTAFQTLPGGRIKRTYRLLDRPADKPIDLGEVEVYNLIRPLRTACRTIPLHWEFVAAPVRLENDYIEELNSLILSAGGEPDFDPYHLNGKDSFLTIGVALKFKRAVQCGDLCCSLEAESKRFELSSSHEVGWVYYDLIEGPITLDRSTCSTPDCAYCIGNKSLKIKIMIETFNDLIRDKDDELNQCDLPLNEELRQHQRMVWLRGCEKDLNAFPCNVPMVGQMMSANRGATDAFSRVSRHVNDSLRKIGNKNNEAGVGFRAGLTGKAAGVVHKIQSCLVLGMARMMMKFGIFPNLPFGQLPASLQSGLGVISPPNRNLLSAKLSEYTSGDLYGLGKMDSSSTHQSFPSKGTTDIALESPMVKEEDAQHNQLVVRHQQVIEELMEENRKLRQILVEDLKVPPSKLQTNSTSPNKSPCSDCVECRRRQRRK